MEVALVAATLFSLNQGGFMEMVEVTNSVAVGKYNPRSLLVLLLDKKTREIMMEQEIHIGKKKLAALCTDKNSDNTVNKLNRFGFCEYNEPGNKFIIRYEYSK